MKSEILFQPSYSVVRIVLEHGESIRAESGAMISMSPTVEVDSKVSGGIGKAIGRLLGGESLFQSFFTAQHGPGEVLLAPAGPGDIIMCDPGPGMVVTSGAYLAGNTALDIKTQANLKGFFGGEGLFMMHVTGPGPLFLSSFGAIHSVDLGPGESYIVDTGHLVAFSMTMNYDLKRAAKGLFGSFTSGEGIVARMTGPGRIYIQTRNPSGFGALLAPHIPAKG